MIIAANSHAIPQAAFKVLPKYDGFDKTPYEHYQDVYFLVSSFDIIDEIMMNRLLSHSFEGKIIEWFKTLTPQSINSWGE